MLIRVNQNNVSGRQYYVGFETNKLIRRTFLKNCSLQSEMSTKSPVSISKSCLILSQGAVQREPKWYCKQPLVGRL